MSPRPARRATLLTAGAAGTALLAVGRAKKQRAAYRRQVMAALHQHDQDALLSMYTATLLTREETVEAAVLAASYRPGAFTNALRSTMLDRKAGDNMIQAKRDFLVRCRAEVGPVRPEPGVYLPGEAFRASQGTSSIPVIPRQRRLRRTAQRTAA